jgi:hypothetical protein
MWLLGEYVKVNRLSGKSQRLRHIEAIAQQHLGTAREYESVRRMSESRKLRRGKSVCGGPTLKIHRRRRFG